MTFQEWISEGQRQKGGVGGANGPNQISVSGRVNQKRLRTKYDTKGGGGGEKKGHDKILQNDTRVEKLCIGCFVLPVSTFFWEILFFTST